jgi:hypothetical protein
MRDLVRPWLFPLAYVAFVVSAGLLPQVSGLTPQAEAASGGVVLLATAALLRRVLASSPAPAPLRAPRVARLVPQQATPRAE